MILASAQDLNGDRASAEQSLREAIRLAPNNAEVHWRLANLLVRENKLDMALEHFRAAITASPTRLQSVLDLVWNDSGEKFEAVDSVAGSLPDVRLGLAFFLQKKSRHEEAAAVFSQIDRQARLRSPSTANFLNALTSAGKVDQAHRLWVELVTGKQSHNPPIVWNGGFEEDPGPVQVRFNWNLSSSKYAAVAIDPATGRTGSRSIRVDFAGIDTTTLDGEFRQLLVTRPGARYRLECFVKTKNLVSPEGPRLVVLSGDTASQIAATTPVAAGSSEWQPLAVDFAVPSDTKTIEIRIRRQPKLSYDEPTAGIIWFDDFSLIELTGSGGRK
jgi:tetratricopeptide (TPR) repeat protein